MEGVELVILSASAAYFFSLVKVCVVYSSSCYSLHDNRGQAQLMSRNINLVMTHVAIDLLIAHSIV